MTHKEEGHLATKNYQTNMTLPKFRFTICIISVCLLISLLVQTIECAKRRDYYYTRTRNHPNHLRISEELKNHYVEEVKYESRINGTKFEYYRASQAMNYDELVFETIDKIFRHRLSPFYIHHYDNEQDKKISGDQARVSQETCARDLLYLVDKLPQRKLATSERSQFFQAPYNDDNDHLTPELSAFFDSYARQEAGLLMGNTYWVGAYDQCVKRHIFELIDASSNQHHSSRGQQQEEPNGAFTTDEHQQAVSFSGRYCVASLKAPIWDQLIERKKLDQKHYFKTQQQMDNYGKLFRIQVGICLPDSCDSTALERHQDEIKLLTSSMFAESPFADYDLIDLYCLPDEASPLRQWSTSAINFLLFLSLWLMLILAATLADMFDLFPLPAKEEGNKKPAKASVRVKRSKLPLLVNWFSLRANYRKLMHVSKPEEEGEKKAQNEEPTASQQQVTTTTTTESNVLEQPKQEIEINLRFLNALKVLIMFWIINGHIMLLMIQTAKNILDSDALLNGLMHFLIGATFGVDLFFTMTGFLTAYLMFNGGHAYSMRLGTWIYLSFHRYWRLAPMYLLSFWFSRSVMQMLGSGPLWDYGTSSITFRGLCNTESWWFPITLTSNLHGLFEECMITSWYISCDMQFWLISPLFIYLLAKSPAQGWMVSLLTIVASSKVRYDAILTDKSARYDELVQPRADIFMRVSYDLPATYTHPHLRISAYIVGLLAGHYVYMIKSGKWRSVLIADILQKQQIQAGCRIVEEEAENESKQEKMGASHVPMADAAGDSRSLLAGTTRDDENEANNVGKCDTENDEEPRRVDAKSTATTTTLTTFMKRELQLRPRTTPPTRAQLSRKWRNLLAYTGLFLFLIMAFVSYLLANYFPSSMLRHSREIAAIFYSIDHLVMSIGASLIIVSICLGQWPSLNKLLSHPNWTRLSKLNYALLLLQCEAIYYQIFRYEQVPVAGTRELINILFNLLVTLYPLAFVATLVFEFPLANIEKLLLG